MKRPAPLCGCGRVDCPARLSDQRDGSAAGARHVSPLDDRRDAPVTTEARS